jgi:hypothetical protein
MSLIRSRECSRLHELECKKASVGVEVYAGIYRSNEMKSTRSFKYGNEIGLEYELIGSMKRTTDPKEIEQNRLDEIERNRRNEAYDLESERLEKEFKDTHPESEHHLWRTPLQHMIANNHPAGWLADFWELEKHIPYDQEEFLTLGQEAMIDDGTSAYNLFLAELIKIPLDWQKDFALVEEHIELSRKEFFLAAQEATSEENKEATYRAFTGKMIAQANAKIRMFAPLKADDDKPARESFPIVALPKTARDFCEAVSSAMQTPEDFAALGILGAMSCAIGASTQFEIKPGWIERPVLWVAICARPGAAKSPSLNACFKPIRGIQQELNIRYSQAMMAYKEKLALAKKDPLLEIPAKPVAEFLLIGDITFEALVRTLSESPRGGAILSDEITSWLGSHDKYTGKGNDRQAYLSLWSSLPLSVHRKLDGVVTVDLPVLSVIGGLTPSSLPRLHGGAEDGFLARILIACPEDRQGIYTKQGINLEWALAYDAFIRKLWELKPEHRDEHGITPKTVKMSKGAESLFEAFYNEMQASLAGDAIPSVLRGTVSKAPSQVARVALVLHCARIVSGEEIDPNLLSAGTMAAAIMIAKYFLNHARVISPELEHGATRASKLRQKVLNWLKRNCTTEKPEADWNALRHDCRRAFTNSFGIVDDKAFEQCLESLQASGHIKFFANKDTKSSKAQKPSITVNPILLQQWGRNDNK